LTSLKRLEEDVSRKVMLMEIARFEELLADIEKNGFRARELHIRRVRSHAGIWVKYRSSDGLTRRYGGGAIAGTEEMRTAEGWGEKPPRREGNIRGD
jgi:hypothetical protein